MAQTNLDRRTDKLVATRNEAFNHARNSPVVIAWTQYVGLR